MNNSNLIRYIAAGLLLINLVLVIFIWKENGKSRREGPKKIIIEKLHFDKGQAQEYESIIKLHHEKIVALENEMLDKKNKLYRMVGLNDSFTKDSILLSIANTQTQIEKTNLEHFEQIKSICKKEQLPYFQELLQEIGTMFSRRKKDHETR
jgi:periplasmic protein CpxP/Spy